MPPQPARLFGLAFAVRVLGALALPTGASLPWVFSGQAKKSMFGLARTMNELGLPRVAEELGFANQTVVRALIWLLFLSPLFAGALVLLQVFGLRRASIGVSAATALFGVLAGIAGLTIGGGLWGPPVTLAAGLISLVGIVLEVARRGRVSRPAEGSRG